MRKDICKHCEFNEFARCGVNFCVLPRCKKEVSKGAVKDYGTAEKVCNRVSETPQSESDTGCD